MTEKGVTKPPDNDRKTPDPEPHAPPAEITPTQPQIPETTPSQTHPLPAEITPIQPQIPSQTHPLPENTPPPPPPYHMMDDGRTVPPDKHQWSYPSGIYIIYVYSHLWISGIDTSNFSETHHKRAQVWTSDDQKTTDLQRVLDEKYTHGMSGKWNYDVHVHLSLHVCVSYCKMGKMNPPLQ